MPAQGPDYAKPRFTSSHGFRKPREKWRQTVLLAKALKLHSRDGWSYSFGVLMPYINCCGRCGVWQASYWPEGSQDVQRYQASSRARRFENL